MVSIAEHRSFISRIDPFKRVPLSTILGYGILILATAFILTYHNPLVPMLTLAFVILSMVALSNGKLGLQLVVGSIIFAGLLKRIPFIISSISRDEYFLMIALPDLVLMATLAYVLLTIQKRGQPLLSMPLDYVVFGYAAWSMLSIFTSGSLALGLTGFKLSGIYIGAYFIGKFLCTSRQDMLRLFRLMIVLALVASIYGIYQRVYGMANFEQAWQASGLTALGDDILMRLGMMRVFSVLDSHEQLGFYIVFSIFGLIALRSMGVKRYGLITMLLFLVTLTLTISRSAWVALLGGCLALLWLVITRRRGMFTKWLPIVAIMFAPLITMYSAEIIYRFTFEFNSVMLQAALNTGTFSARVNAWTDALNVPNYITVFGHGLGTAWATNIKFGGTMLAPHNGILQIIYELGLVGLVLFELILFFFWRTGLQVLKRSPMYERYWYKIALSLMAIVTGVAISNATVAELLMLRPIAFFFWLSIGIVTGMYMRLGESE